MPAMQRDWGTILVRKLLLLLGILGFPGISMAAWFSGPGPDYAQGAGNTYVCVSTAAIVSQAGVSKTAPVVGVFNPPGSGKNLVILDVGIDVVASPAAAAQFSLAYSTSSTTGLVYYSTGTFQIPALIPTTVQSTTTLAGIYKGICIGGQGTLLANTPIVFRDLGGTTGASAISGVILTDQTNGKVVVPPGAVVSLQSSSSANIQANFTIREDPQ
jgi:hypothetical protein